MRAMRDWRNLADLRRDGGTRRGPSHGRACFVAWYKRTVNRAERREGKRDTRREIASLQATER